MTLVYTELIGSRAMTRDKSSFTASRTFLVYDDTGSVLLIDDAINNFTGVFFSDQHPDINGIYAKNFSIKASSTRASTWEVTWQYAQPMNADEAGGVNDPFSDDINNTSLNIIPEPDEGGDGTGGGGGGDGSSGDEGTDEDEDDSNDQARLFTGWSINSGVALIDGWRADATIPASGSQGGDDGYEMIDGTDIHKGGKPITIPVPTATIGISVTFFGATIYLNNVQLKAGMRNSGAFYGFASGSVLFTGFNVQRQTETSWDITYNFAWDAFFHMRQLPNRDEDGTIDFEDDGTLKVWWKQPFPSTTSFSFSP